MFFQAEDGIRYDTVWLEFRRVLFRSLTLWHFTRYITYSHFNNYTSFLSLVHHVNETFNLKHRINLDWISQTFYRDHHSNWICVLIAIQRSLCWLLSYFKANKIKVDQLVCLYVTFSKTDLHNIFFNQINKCI